MYVHLYNFFFLVSLLCPSFRNLSCVIMVWGLLRESWLNLEFGEDEGQEEDR